MKLPLLILVGCLASGCAASVSRIGYERPVAPPVASDPAADAQETSVLLTGDLRVVQGDSARLLGRVRYRDGGFSTRCDEASALRLFRGDAESVGANVVLIINEKASDLWSTCYRAEAGLYHVPDTLRVASVLDRRDPDRLVVNRGSQSQQQLWAVAGYTAGTLLGVALASALFGSNRR